MNIYKSENFNNSHLYSRMFQLPWRLYLLVICAALLVVAIIVFSIKTSDRMTRVYTPAIDAVMVIKLEVTTAHLWLEEILGGDNTKEFSDFKQQLDRALQHTNLLIEGGESEEWKFGLIDDPDFLRDIQAIQAMIYDFQSIATERLAMAKVAGAGSDSDHHIDAIYNKIIKDTDESELLLQQLIAKDQRHFYSMQCTLIIISLLLAFLVVFTLYHYQRTIVHHFKDLQHAETRYTTLVEQIPAVTYVAKLDTLSSTVYVSPQIETLLGVSAEEFIKNSNLFVEMLHADDRQRVIEEL